MTETEQEIRIVFEQLILPTTQKIADLEKQIAELEKARDELRKMLEPAVTAENLQNIVASEDEDRYSGSD